MRTTLDIEDDILEAAKDLARAEGKTVGEIISILARKALTAPMAPPADRSSGFAEPQAAFDTGTWPTLPGRDGLIVTTEVVRRIEDAIDREDIEPADFAADRPPASPPTKRARKRRS